MLPGPTSPTERHHPRRDGIREAYAQGHGRIVLRALAGIEESKAGRFQVVVTELPFQVNKATLLEKIADLVQQKKIDGISDLRDESDRQGLRIVVELKRDAKPRTVLNQLYKHTTMQTAFGVNTLGLVDGQPRVMPIKRMLGHHVEYRQIVLRRRTDFELKKAQERAHSWRASRSRWTISTRSSRRSANPSPPTRRWAP